MSVIRPKIFGLYVMKDFLFLVPISKETRINIGQYLEYYKRNQNLRAGFFTALHSNKHYVASWSLSSKLVIKFVQTTIHE